MNCPNCGREMDTVEVESAASEEPIHLFHYCYCAARGEPGNVFPEGEMIRKEITDLENKEIQ